MCGAAQGHGEGTAAPGRAGTGAENPPVSAVLGRFLGVWDLRPSGPQTPACGRGELASTCAPADAGGLAASRPSRSQGRAGEQERRKCRDRGLGLSLATVHTSESPEPGPTPHHPGTPAAARPEGRALGGGNGMEGAPLHLSAHPPRSRSVGACVTGATSALPGGSRVVRTPLKRGQGTTPGPIRGTFPEPSQWVAPSPFPGASARSWDGRRGAGQQATVRYAEGQSHPACSRSRRHERQKSEQNRRKRSRRALARAGGFVCRSQALQTLLLTPVKELPGPSGGSYSCSGSTRHGSRLQAAVESLEGC
uniref:Uncharacterized protein n=1 Tax=Rangifer tarandus platyrhynchus TaxID=3082113 RepID=A0ACB0DZD2_RANTA|nr:unnamed protein product [Rangifer tarandus platyrhynchus]